MPIILRNAKVLTRTTNILGGDFMSLFNNLERKFRRCAISNITLYLILGQALFFVFDLLGCFILDQAVLIPALVSVENGGGSSHFCLFLR